MFQTLSSDIYNHDGFYSRFGGRSRCGGVSNRFFFFCFFFLQDEPELTLNIPKI